MQGKNIETCKKCTRYSCCHPTICPNLNTSHEPITNLYREVGKLKPIKKSFVSSGVRYDLFLNNRADDKEKESHREYIKELVTRHVSGRLKVAPEHTSDSVLKMMRKPGFQIFRDFYKQFIDINKRANLNQQLVPYFISGHPGCTEKDMALLAVETRHLEFNLEQVQEFTPTPMTLATEIYYSGIDPYTQKPIFTARSKDEKTGQKQFFFWYKPEMREGIVASLKKNNLVALTKNLFGTVPASKETRDVYSDKKPKKKGFNKGRRRL